MDVISGGRLVLGLGVGGTHQSPGAGGIPGGNPAIAEYEAYGLALVPPAEGIARLAETEGVARWSADEIMAGRHAREAHTARPQLTA
ncbi:LLM class oxidoreductase [Streptomyces chiangmaiensis]|uniref:hypothetical protein n=1 Tax=Streptomyces chiangmaiensis TaxID=766497 RepID=UPI00336F2AA7